MTYNATCRDTNHNMGFIKTRPKKIIAYNSAGSVRANISYAAAEEEPT